MSDEIVIANEKWQEDKDKSYDIAWEAHKAQIGAITEFRSYVRALDIPLLSTEQRNYVDAIRDFVDAKNRYMESESEDLSVNDYIIPLDDAATDFNNAMWDICDR